VLQKAMPHAMDADEGSMRTPSCSYFPRHVKLFFIASSWFQKLDGRGKRDTKKSTSVSAPSRQDVLTISEFSSIT
ncbi:MAG TPA: hypothetical protein VGY31_02335, partial [Terriglobia bacterium]|nr:hypothetical protein [Terriglobia bacterium]